MNRGILNKLLTYAFILFLGIVVADLFFPGVKVVVENGGPGTMTEPTVTLLGKTFTLENIPPQENAVFRTRLRGKTTVDVEYTNEQGERVKLTVPERPFTGIDGTVRIVIKEDKLELVEPPVAEPALDKQAK